MRLCFSLNPALAAFIACLLAGPASAAPSFSPRIVEDQTRGWLFVRTDAPHAEQPQTDTHDWQAISLPHVVVADQGDGVMPDYYRGKAWYRHELNVDTAAGKRRFLEFDGAALSSELWINGVHVGMHKGGFSRFRFDVTDYLKPGRNLIAVRIDSSRQNDMAPLGGDYTVFGGIYRPVRLITTNPVHFDMLDYGGPGVYVGQSHVTAAGADLSWKALVRNDSKSAMGAKVRVRLLDATGKAVADQSQAVTLPAGQVTPLTLSAHVNAPHLWQGVADPYLYTSEVTIVGEGTKVVIDAQTIPTGIRDIRFDPDHGLYLNGKPYNVHGVDIHQSMRPGAGPAVGDAAVDEDFRILEDMGVTGLRLAHYQHPQRDYDKADRDGILLWTELPLSSEIDPSPEFEANAGDQLRELIRQNMNHPSVMVWGLGNEIYKSDADSNRILDHMNALAHAEDPSRPTSYANCCGPVTQPHASHTDLLGSNVYFGWYSGEFADLTKWGGEAHRLISHTPMALSEYGAGASVIQQEDPPKRPVPASRWHPEQYQALYHEAAWRQITTMPWLWGTFVWAGFDFPSAGRKEGDRDGINDKGLITFDRKVKKDAYFWYQAQWSPKPMVYITSRRDTVRKDAAVDIKVYSNRPKVTLRLNGQVAGTLDVTDHMAIWHVTLKPGENRIEADAGGVNDAVTWTLNGG